MVSKSMTGGELGEKLLASVRDMKAGKSVVVHTPMIVARCG